MHSEENEGETLEDLAKLSPDAMAKRMADFQRKVEEALRGTFRPEFLNRIDEVITFHELSIANMEPIVDLQLNAVRKRLADRRITLDVTPAVRQQLAIDGFDPMYGARPLKRLVQREIVDRIAEKAVTGELLDGCHVFFDVNNDGEYQCRIEKPIDYDSLLS